MKEANIKNDFLKAISGHKPTEVFRVHADIGNDKVGITGWYTKAVIDDVVDDIKKKGVKILKIEKSTDPKHLKETKDKKDGGLGGQFSVAQLENLRKEYSSLDKKGLTESRLREIARTLGAIPTPGLRQLSRAGIAVLSPLAEIVANEKKETV